MGRAALSWLPAPAVHKGDAAAPPRSAPGALSSAAPDSASAASSNDPAFCVPLAGVLPQHPHSIPRDRPPSICIVPADAWSAASTHRDVDFGRGAEASRMAPRELFWISEDSSVGSAAASPRWHQKEVRRTTQREGGAEMAASARGP